MVAKSAVPVLQAAHVFFNAGLFLAFAFQGVLGWRIRRRRRAGTLQDFPVVKRHRVLGPILASLLPVGYLVGLFTVRLHKGVWAAYPGHLAGGTALLTVTLAAVLVSRRIRGAPSPWRTLHAELGLLLLCVFLVQVFLGLNIFL